MTDRPTPGRGRTPTAQAIDPAAPDEFGLTQVWWGDGKGKTTATLGMAFRAAGHGFRVHVLQFMKGGADSVADVRGEYNAITAVPGISYENLGHYGWHAMNDGTEERDHAAEAEAGLDRAHELVAAADDADLTSPFDPDSDPDDGVHMLVFDEILYAADRELVDPEAVVRLVEEKPENLELVLSGSHSRPEYLIESADLVTNVRKEKHPIDDGQRARMGTEY
ncbi:cob(I)alamin adenosyltransferase [Natronomonas pharaonis DSM 2160]|uniref:Cob(I)alamin adenosyltransferase n=1 Tax=Natronomonas pharaonis (strain ATCC 35678 / DSM 2160 / CIP 103997 / JCM 8858 / NBRC 14720 / NCIMB 2260 / Gabara) TaxID=348780 RepID=A0A1U7EZ71_NATPD|nr:cob(I)yrinic acid a,c-diamide adenosyltransferase [Natronomonas pharaonis]CAI50578.1 cob(I)alamin adenosyltransferase [Natronomonas pharaonis DSM 2160]